MAISRRVIDLPGSPPEPRDSATPATRQPHRAGQPIARIARPLGRDRRRQHSKKQKRDRTSVPSLADGRPLARGLFHRRAHSIPELLHWFSFRFFLFLNKLLKVANFESNMMPTSYTWNLASPC